VGKTWGYDKVGRGGFHINNILRVEDFISRGAPPLQKRGEGGWGGAVPRHHYVLQERVPNSLHRLSQGTLQREALSRNLGGAQLFCKNTHQYRRGCRKASERDLFGIVVERRWKNMGRLKRS